MLIEMLRSDTEHFLELFANLKVDPRRIKGIQKSLRVHAELFEAYIGGLAVEGCPEEKLREYIETLYEPLLAEEYTWLERKDAKQMATAVGFCTSMSRAPRTSRLTVWRTIAPQK